MAETIGATVFACLFALLLYLKWRHENRCKHQWERFDETSVFSGTTKNPNDLPVSRRVTVVCKKCGDIKRINI